MKAAACYTSAVLPVADPPKEGSERVLVRVQAVSGLSFATFLALHLANSVAASLGPESYDALMARLRGYYQTPLVEILAVGASGAVHVACGLARLRNRRRRAREQRRAGRAPVRAPLWLRVHRLSGYFLLLVIVGHVLATRGPGLFLDQPADFSYLTFSLTTWPAAFFPYYFLLFSSGTYHLMYGAGQALRVFGLRPNLAPHSSRLAAALFGVALLGGVAGILAMGGILAEPDTSRFGEFRALYERYAPFMVTW